MPDKNKKFTPENTFDINVKIKDYNYTSDLRGIRILSSILSPYQIVEMDFLLDPNDIILENLYGKDPIKVNIRTKGKGNDILEQIDLELMLLDTNYSITSKNQLSDGKQKEKQPFNIKTVCRKPFETMTTLVNAVYHQVTIRDIITDLVQNEIGANLQFNSDGENKETINQIVIPPTTLYKIIKENNFNDNLEGYLDKCFGYYDGVPSVFCHYDNTVKIKNLTKKLSKSQKITIHHLASDKDNTDLIKETISGDKFYTYTDLSTKFGGNKKLTRLANNVNYISKPFDSLYKILKFNMNDIATNKSLNPSSKKVQINQSVNKRKKYNVEDRGDEYSKTFVNSFLSRMISDMSVVEVQLERDIQLTNLMEIGEPVKLKTQTAEYSDLAGKYILYSSLINFSRGDPNSGTQWISTASLKLGRTVV